MGKLDAALDVNEAVGIRRIVIRVNVHYRLLLAFLRLREEFKYALGRRCRLLQNVAGVGKLVDRHGELPDILHKRLNIAYGHRTVRRTPCAENADGDPAEIADKIHHRHHDAG